MLADKGFDNYQNVVVTSPKMVKEKSELVQKFVNATAKGWASYLHGDPAPANALIRAANPAMGDDLIAYAIGAMNKYGVVETADTKATMIGAMTHQRWKGFYDTMVAAGAQPPGTDIQNGYTLQFVGRQG